GLRSDGGDDSRLPPETRGSDGDVRRAAADRLRKRLHPGERHAELLGVQIDAHAPDRQQLELRHVLTASLSSWVIASSSAPPAISCTSSSRVTSPFAWSPITRPRLSRTKWSPTGKAWCGLWVMKMTPTPRCADCTI